MRFRIFENFPMNLWVKASTKLGITLAAKGKEGAFVKSLQGSHTIKIGSQLLAINDVQVHALSFEEIVEILQQTQTIDRLLTFDHSHPEPPIRTRQSIQQVASGPNHTLLLTEDGTVLAFGQNTCGKLGLGHEEDTSSPQMIKNL